jgi:hypothetical protein
MIRLPMACRFRLDPDIDREACRIAFGRCGRVRIGPFLRAEDAGAAASELVARDDWQMMIKLPGGKPFVLAQHELGRWEERNVAGLRQLASAVRGDDYGYVYDRIVARDDRHPCRGDGSLLAELAAFMSGDTVRDLVGAITGEANIAFTDVFASRFGAGDFLSMHDDSNHGGSLDRAVAFVLSLSSGWQSEWGGLLSFQDPAGDVTLSLPPAFNTLTLFKVPQAHSVTPVTAAAPVPRLSVTGWYRRASDGPPER